MKKKPLLLLVLAFTLIAALTLAGCAPVQETPMEPTQAEMTEPTEAEPPAEEETAGAEVAMQGNTFQPAEISISAGTTVTWTNEDAVGHTVTSGTRGSPSGMFDESVNAGGTFSFTFTESGTYEYFCSIHPGMDGTVIVE